MPTEYHELSLNLSKWIRGGNGLVLIGSLFLSDLWWVDDYQEWGLDHFQAIQKEDIAYEGG